MRRSSAEARGNPHPMEKPVERKYMPNWKEHPEKYILAILSGLISFIIYFDTMAPTVSFWDCGEFIATSYILGVPHPPGSPFYLLLGRFFSMLPIGSDIAYRVNLMSPIVSAFSISFLFLIIVQLLKKWGRPDSLSQKLAIYGGAFIGAMTFAFTDSHWFNAVEAEVYAFSTFLTAIVVWLILAWEDQVGQKGHERYLLIIAYIMGLAMGIHLLNLLAIFFIALIIYFKRRQISSIWWFMADIIISIVTVTLLFLFAQQLSDSFGVQAFITLAGFAGIYIPLYRSIQKPRFREHAQNVLMAAVASAVFLLINSGVIRGLPKMADRFGLLVVAVLILAVFVAAAVAIQKRRNLLALALGSLILIFIGYSSYATIFIRSNQNPAIDENDPETTHRAVSYLEREQYGRREFTDIFDRAVWKPEAAHKYSGAGDYFWNYQIKHMYIRYFNWQFIGRVANRVDPFQFLLPFPFLLGIYGLLTHFQRDRNKALAVLALFLFTGLMIVLYLNQDDPQPRERDYSYVGSFFTFAIWIGIGVSSLIQQIAQLTPRKFRSAASWGVSILLLVILPVNVLVANYESHSRKGNYIASDYAHNILETCAPNGIIFTNGDNDTFPLWYMQEVEGIRTDVRVVNLSLANTGWYLLQLKHDSPRGAKPVELKISDTDLKAITYVPVDSVDVAVPSGSEQRKLFSDARRSGVSLPATPSDSLRWRIRPGLSYQGATYLRPQDIAVYMIVSDNYGKRPIYFALTVAPTEMIGLDRNLRLDGLVYRVVPLRSGSAQDFSDPGTLYGNLFNTYRYRNIGNLSVNIDETSRNLLGNYPPLFGRLALDLTAAAGDSVRVPDQSGVLQSRQRRALAYEVLDRYEELFPLERYPVSPSFAAMVASLRISEGAKQKAYPYINYLEVLASRNDVREEPELYLLLSQVYRKAGDTGKADAVLNHLKQSLPELRERLDSLKQ